MNKLRKLLLICLTVISIACFATACQEQNNNTSSVVIGDTFIVKGETLIGVTDEIKYGTNVVVEIPYGIEVIGDNAFADCKEIVSLTIPSSVKKISSTAFLDCENLSEIKVDAKNRRFVEQDNILYDINKTQILLVPANSSLTELEVGGSIERI